MILNGRMFIYLMIFVSCNIVNYFFVEGLTKIGIDSIYSVLDHFDGGLIFIMENGRVFVKEKHNIFGKIHELSKKDQVIDFQKLDDRKFVLLVQSFDCKKLTLRQIEIKNFNEVGLNWDLDIKFSKKVVSRRIFSAKGKLYLLLENNFLVIDEIKGVLLESDSFTIEKYKSFISLKFDDLYKPELLAIFDQNTKNVILYNLKLLKNNFQELKPLNTIELEKNVNIILNSGIFYEKNGHLFLSLLFIRTHDLNFGLLEYLVRNERISYSDLNLNIYFLNETLRSKMLTELTLKETESKELIMTSSRYGNGLNQNFFYIFEQNPSFILKSFMPIINETQSSSIHIFNENHQDKISDYLTIISYNDLSNYLSFTTIFDYKKTIDRNLIYRYTLKIEYKNREIKINHGPILYSTFVKNGNLILQWEDSITLFISLNCDISRRMCFKPEIKEIYEGVTLFDTSQDEFENNFIVYNSLEMKENNKLENSISKLEISSFMIANNLYYDSYDKDEMKYISSETNGNILLIINKNYSIFGYLIEKDLIIWRNDVLRKFLDSIKMHGKNKIRQFIIGDRNFPILFIIVNDLVIFKINIHTGATVLSEVTIPESSRIITTSSFKAFGEPLLDPRFILLNKNNKIIKILDLNDLNLSDQEIMIRDKIKYYIVNQKDNIKCFKISYDINPSLEWQYSFDKNEEILIYGISNCPNCKYFPIVVSEDYEIINKFNYPNLLAIVTNRQKIMLFNSINGNLLYSATFPETFRPPFTIGIYQNTVIMTSYHILHQIPVILILELYQFLDKYQESRISGIFEKFKFLISSEKNVQESRIFSEKPVKIRKSIFLYQYELPITTLVVTNTLESITSKFILFGNEYSNIIEGVSEHFFSKQRSHFKKYYLQNSIQDKDISTSEPIAPQRTKFLMGFSSVRKILTFSHSVFESTSFFILVGLDCIEIDRFYPNSSFDTLPGDFNKKNVVISLVLVISITFIAIHLLKKTHKQWK